MMLQQPIESVPYGSVIRDVDCAEISSEMASKLCLLLAEQQILVFPGQNHVTPAQEVAFYQAINSDCHSIWRDQKSNPWEKFKVEQGNKAGTYQIPDVPGVLVLGKGDIDQHGLQVTLGGSRSAYGRDSGSQVLGGGDLQWHIDGTFYEHHPCRITQMRCVEAPSGEGHWVDYHDGSGDRILCAAGATAFASGRVAFDLLPEESQQTCLNTKVHYASKPFQTTLDLGNNHNGLRVLDAAGENGSQVEMTPTSQTDPLAKSYPLVWTCQQTGVRALMPHPRCLSFLEEGSDAGRKILNLSDSRDRIEALMRPAIAPSNVYVHNWKAGDLVLWDNYSMWHSATGQLSDTDRRVMHLTAFNASRAPT